jgi:hypothetical protein
MIAHRRYSSVNLELAFGCPREGRQLLRMRTELSRDGRHPDHRSAGCAAGGSVVTIGRAFHWMDRADTLRRLDALIEPDGALILFNDVRPDVPENIWYKQYTELVDSYASRDACIPLDRLRHEAVLLDSSFNRLVRIGVIERREVPVERLVDRALSMSTSSPEQLGPLSDRLAQELLTKMSQFATDGIVVEVVESQALIARRREAGAIGTS